MRKLALTGVVALSLTTVASAAVRMNGYGATRKAWAAHHVRDPNPKLIKGCCYLPRQADGRDRYYAVFQDGGRVYGYSMHFAPRSPRASHAFCCVETSFLPMPDSSVVSAGPSASSSNTAATPRNERWEARRSV